MNKIIIACILSLAVIASAKPAAKIDTKTVLSEIEQSKFGSSVMSFLHLNSLGDVPTDELTSVLDELLDQLNTRQADADGFNNTNQALCDETLSNLENQINTETSTIASLENTIQVEGENLDAAKRELNQAAGDLDETEESLENGTAQREAEHTKWVDNDYQHNEAIVAIEETVKLIKHMIHGVTFAQIKPRYEKVQETLKSSTKFGTLFKPLILSLSELATKLNYEQIVQILDLLNNIQEALQDARTAAANSEAQSEEDWDTLEATLSDQKTSLSEKKSRLNSLITQTEEIIDQSEGSLSFHTQNLRRLQAAHDEQSHWCDTQSDLYVDETNERSRQTEILDRLQENIEDNFGAVAAYLQTRQL